MPLDAKAGTPAAEPANPAQSCGIQELIRVLLNNSSVERHSGEDFQTGAGEEIIADTEVDGDRYLVIRLPKSRNDSVRLSPREREIVRMVAQGHSNKIIADVLNISSWTVGTHLRRIFAKLGVGSRAAVVARLPEISRTRAASAAVVLRQPDPHSIPSGDDSQCFTSVRSEPVLRRNG